MILIAYVVEGRKAIQGMAAIETFFLIIFIAYLNTLQVSWTLPPNLLWTLKAQVRSHNGHRLWEKYCFGLATILGVYASHETRRHVLPSWSRDADSCRRYDLFRLEQHGLNRHQLC